MEKQIDHDIGFTIKTTNEKLIIEMPLSNLIRGFEYNSYNYSGDNIPFCRIDRSKKKQFLNWIAEMLQDECDQDTGQNFMDKMLSYLFIRVYEGYEDFAVYIKKINKLVKTNCPFCKKETECDFTVTLHKCKNCSKVFYGYFFRERITMKDYTKEQINLLKPFWIDGIKAIDFCLEALYNDEKHNFKDNIVLGLTFEELINSILSAKDNLELYRYYLKNLL